MEAFQKYTNLDPSSLEVQLLILKGQYFITQSAPDIQRKLQKLQMSSQTLMAQLVDIVFSVFNNCDLEEKTEQSQCEKKKEEK